MAVRRVWSGYDSGRRRAVLGMIATVAALHLAGWGMLFALVVPGHYAVFGAGLGLTAYTLGVRHAFDADHIAAIDNTTRKLVADNGKPMTAGFWFSLGHSTVVFVMVFALGLGVRALAGGIEDGNSGLRRWTGVLGTGVSAGFLLLLGLLNLVSLMGIAGVLRALRHGRCDERELERRLESRGALARMVAPLLRAVRSPRRMYPIGLLFGLGFDTVTEVGLLVLAGGAAATGMPWYAIVVLPLLFSAGMVLFDSLDGAYMNYAYGWAFAEPIRKIYYNLVVTGLSVAVALLIGGQEIISLLAGRCGIGSGPLAWIAGLNLGSMGLIVVALFLGTWLLALAVWRYGHVERRWRVGRTSGAAS
ncbi:HoxN/HupN/NixA family nickel/cobalt transporter [Nocardia alni]|uniref:HoxN/HupN/NixA family nickel/cobalt transporter n=1 Tax=Nocardia alni TaxID=2815723 RepID=UPI001C23EA0E|nr:HoxN/HupN/NixA family nickel/cobalt transporter [Nocardia alni]